MISLCVVLVMNLAAAGQAIPALPFPEPKTVAEFMKGMESDTTGVYFVALADPHPRKAETFLRAAQKQAPSRQRWAVMAAVLFDIERSNASRLPAAARAAVFQHALTYLQEWHDLTAAALKSAPTDKQLVETLPSLKSDLAVAALEAGQLDAARKHATEALAANTDTKNWNYGNVVDAMNQVLGRAALRQGNRDEARRALLAAGATPGSPQLNSYGPTFVLAREMLGKGEKDVVLQYLDSVGKFWGHDDPKRPQRRALVAEQAALLAKWRQEIRAGKIPTDVNWR